MATPGTLRLVIVTSAALAVAACLGGPVAAAPPTPSGFSRADNHDDPGPTRLFQRVYRAAVRADSAARRMVTFDAEADAYTSDAIGDAAEVASDAIVAVANWPDGRRWLAQIDSVRIAAGPDAAVSVRDGAIIIEVNPFEGEAGRPSSLAIQRAVGARALDLVACHGAVAGKAVW